MTFYCYHIYYYICSVYNHCSRSLQMNTSLQTVDTRGLLPFLQGRTLVYLKYFGSRWMVLLVFVVTTEGYCPAPNIPHGTVTAPRGNTLGAWVKVRCHEGFTWVGPARSICTSRGIWDPPMSKCYDRCKKPIIENSAEVTGPKTLEHGNVIQVICRDRATIANQGIIQCWNGTFIWGRDWAKKDEKIECTAFCPEPSVQHSSVTTTDGRDVSSLATINCRKGYTCRGSHTCRSLCGPDGEWFPELPRCLAKCKHPNVANAIGQPGTAMHEDGSQHMVTCRFGYDIRHDGHLVCDNGQWRFLDDKNDKEVECRPVRCEKAEMVISYALSTQGIDPVHGDTEQITCIEGYYIKHQGAVRCDDGVWIWHNTSILDMIECIKVTVNHGPIHQITTGGPIYAGQFSSKGSSHWHMESIPRFFIPSLIISYSRYSI